MTGKKTLVLLGIALGAASILSACGWHHPNSAAAATHGKFFAVTADKTSFYRYGPLQGNGADRQLPKDTLITLIRRSFGYSKVRLTDGEQGFVANEDIQIAPESLIVQATTDTSVPDVPLPESAASRLTLPEPTPEVEPTAIPELMPPQ